MNKEKIPSFFNYKEENSDNGYETIQDFFLSWSIRCSVRYSENFNEQLYEYSRQIVFFLIFGKNINNKYLLTKDLSDDFEVIEVETKRQWNYIDLIANITYTIDKEKKKVSLIIENKFYTKLGRGQLEKINDSITSIDNDIRRLVIYIDSSLITKEEINKCIKNNFLYLTIDEIKEAILINKQLTTNDIFDEYWFKW